MNFLQCCSNNTNNFPFPTEFLFNNNNNINIPENVISEFKHESVESQISHLPSPRKEDLAKKQIFYPQLRLIIENSNTMEKGTQFIITPNGPLNSERTKINPTQTSFGYNPENKKVKLLIILQ